MLSRYAVFGVTLNGSLIYTGKKIWEEFIEKVTKDAALPPHITCYTRSGEQDIESTKQLFARLEETNEDRSITNVDIYLSWPIVEAENTKIQEELNPELFTAWVNLLLHVLEESELFLLLETEG